MKTLIAIGLALMSSAALAQTTTCTTIGTITTCQTVGTPTPQHIVTCTTVGSITTCY
jgi:hypothetical protein